MMEFPNNQIIPPEIVVNNNNTEFTVTEAGLYMVWVTTRTNASAVRVTRTSLLLNGQTISFSGVGLDYHDVLPLTAGDTFSVFLEVSYTGELMIMSGQIIIMKLS